MEHYAAILFLAIHYTSRIIGVLLIISLLYRGIAYLIQKATRTA